ncbi:efflux RND transporter permease subunit, partial [Acinetobacter baumannii]
IGGVTREIQVLLNPDRLMALGITAAEVNAQIRATNLDTSGGKGQINRGEQAIRTLGGAETVTALSDTKISVSGGRKVRLSDLGEVRDSWVEP